MFENFLNDIKKDNLNLILKNIPKKSDVYNMKFKQSVIFLNC